MAKTIEICDKTINKDPGATKYETKVVVLLKDGGNPQTDIDVSMALGNGKPVALTKTDIEGKASFTFVTTDNHKAFITFEAADYETMKYKIDLRSGKIEENSETTSSSSINLSGSALPPNMLVCQHCQGSASCSNGKKFGKSCSCEYCIKKADVKTSRIFPIVPCAYCSGKGFHDIAKQQQSKDQNQGNNKPNRDNSRRDNQGGSK